MLQSKNQFLLALPAFWWFLGLLVNLSLVGLGLSIFSKNNLSPAGEECGRDCGQGGVVSAGDPGDAELHRVAAHPGHLDTEEGRQRYKETCYT